MSLTKTIAKNTVWHTLGKFGGSAIGVLIVALVTRYLGLQGYGYYTTIIAYLFFFATIGDLGLYLVTINELGKAGVDEKKLFSNIFSMRAASGLVLMVVANLVVWLFPYPEIVKVGTAIFSITVFLTMVDQVTTALFQVKMKTKFVAVAEILGKAVTLALTWWVIKQDAGFLAVLLAVVVGFIIHFLINIWFGRKLVKFKLEFDRSVWLSVLKKSWPVATYMIFSMIYFKADTIVLSLFHPQAVVGLYGAPYKILEVLIAFPAIFMGLVSPQLSRAWSESNRIDFKKYFQKAFDFLSLVSWPLIFGTLVLAEPIMVLIAGSAFVASAAVLKILMVATAIIFVAHLSTFAVVAVGKQRQMMRFYIVAAILAVGLYFALIPKYSYLAAAWVTVGVEFFILLASWLMVSRTVGMRINVKNCLKSLSAAGIMAFCVWVFEFNLWQSVLLAGLTYVVFLYLMGGLNIVGFKK